MDIWRVYTDGSCTNQIGGWAAVIVFGEKIVRELSGTHRGSTNNRMELQGVIETCKFVRGNLEMFSPKPVVVISDSQYVVYGYNEWSKDWAKKEWKGSKGEPVKNKDLWLTLLDEAQDLPVEIFWQRGHNKCPFNDRADYLAKKASQ